MTKPLLYGPTGKPLAGNLYVNPRSNPKLFRPRPNLARTTPKNVTAYDRSQLVEMSRLLRSQVDPLNTAIEQKNSWAFDDAWNAHFNGADTAWGEIAEAWLRDVWYPLCNIRGRYFHFNRSMKLSGKAWDTDGDDLMILTETATGFPQVAYFPATRVGSGPDGKNRNGETVKGGAFDGANIVDGIITDRNWRMLGVRILNEDGEGSSDFSSYNVDLAFEPDWSDQGRGIPRVAVSLLRWMNLQDIDEFLQRGMKRASAVGLVAKTANGQAPVANIVTSEEDSPVTDGTSGVTKVHYEAIEGGELYYLDAGANETLESLKFENPHPNAEAFIARLERGALAAVGWNYELLNIGSTGRAPTRMLADLANQSIWSRQDTGEIRAYRAVSYAIAKAMKRGDIPRNPILGDAYMWEFGMPKPLSVDQGNDEAADRENLKLGTSSKTIIAQKKGYHRNEIRRHRRAEIMDLYQDALETEQKTGGKIPFDKALELFEQRGANPVSQAVESAQPAEQPNNSPA